jgi:hypothetical protein
MPPLPLYQFSPDSRLVLDAAGYHYCLAASPGLAAEIVEVVNGASTARLRDDAGRLAEHDPVRARAESLRSASQRPMEPRK